MDHCRLLGMHKDKKDRKKFRLMNPALYNKKALKVGKKFRLMDPALYNKRSFIVRQLRQGGTITLTPLPAFM